MVKPVGALVNGLRILRYLAAANAAVGVSRIARDLDINLSTSHNLLKTLAAQGMVLFNENKTYSIGLGAVELAKGALEKASYVHLVHPQLEEIALRHNVAVTLWQRVPNERVMLVDHADNGSTVRLQMNIGQRSSMFAAALGRCMAAGTKIELIELLRRFQDLPWEQPPIFDEYWQEVQEAAVRGYAVDHGHFVRGITTISAAIPNEHGEPVMAISTVALSAQMSPASIENIGNDLRERAQAISRSLFGLATATKTQGSESSAVTQA